jgi:hypothetical protein
MTQANSMTYTKDLRDRMSLALTERLQGAVDAIDAGDLRQAATHAGQLGDLAAGVRTAVARDMLAAGADWWQIGEHLDLHPQAAFEQYGAYRQGVAAPAEQRPGLAVLVTAGLAAEHDWDDEFGIDLEDLGADHSLFADPTVTSVRAAAQLLGDDVWIAVRLPGEYEGDGEASDEQVIKQWTTVVLAEDELTWLREALQLNAVDDQAEADDDLDPLD